MPNHLRVILVTPLRDLDLDIVGSGSTIGSMNRWIEIQSKIPPILVVLNLHRQHFIAAFNRIDHSHIFRLTEYSVFAI
jgi:hypothetical protein